MPCCKAARLHSAVDPARRCVDFMALLSMFLCVPVASPAINGAPENGSLHLWAIFWEGSSAANLHLSPPPLPPAPPPPPFSLRHRQVVGLGGAEGGGAVAEAQGQGGGWASRLPGSGALGLWGQPGVKRLPWKDAARIHSALVR